MSGLALIARIDALLPQTQCEKCGHPGCRPYAEAIAAGEVHNKCPPGRQETVDALAQLLHRPALPLDAKPEDTIRRVAVIREAECIGCTKCIAACPVDAIVGAALQMHTVIADHCTGCDLCLPPCPVDCIDMVVLAEQQFDPLAVDAARRRHDARDLRLAREKQQRQARRRTVPPETQATVQPAVNPVSPEPAKGTPADASRLRALAATARRQYKEAAQALVRAERAGHADLATMRARVAALKEKADIAQQSLNKNDSP